jgi:hypothetical protein
MQRTIERFCSVAELKMSRYSLWILTKQLLTFRSLLAQM